MHDARAALEGALARGTAEPHRPARRLPLRPLPGSHPSRRKRRNSRHRTAGSKRCSPKSVAAEASPRQRPPSSSTRRRRRRVSCLDELRKSWPGASPRKNPRPALLPTVTGLAPPRPLQDRDCVLLPDPCPTCRRRCRVTRPSCDAEAGAHDRQVLQQWGTYPDNMNSAP